MEGIMPKEVDTRPARSDTPGSDGLFKQGMIPDWLDSIFHLSVTPVISLLSAGRVNPNWVTTGGFLLIMASGYFIMTEHFYYAVGFIILGGICDFVDGKVAARTNHITQFGAIYDSVLDRYSDMIVFIALAIYFYHRSSFISALIAIFALVGGFMTSYIKAVGKAHGIDFRVGFLRRQERMTIVSIALVFNFLDPCLRNWLGSHNASADISPNVVIVACVWFLAVFSNVTAIQRLIKLRDISKGRNCTP
jgi:CDP-diacylglycerol---glycerol-3-phosphate 3-phosphatidyltransferase